MDEIKNAWQEMILSCALVVLLLFFINPGEIFGMTHAAEMALCGLFLLVFLLFFAFIWRERPADEREKLHQRFAGRTAFLAGTGILAVGIVAEILMGGINLWLPVALGGMILAKSLSLAYSRWKG